VIEDRPIIGFKPSSFSGLFPLDILLEKDKIKIIDFGMATFCMDGEKLSETMGTVAYMVSIKELMEQAVHICVPADFPSPISSLFRGHRLQRSLGWHMPMSVTSGRAV
jgi:hypothetical protein